MRKKAASKQLTKTKVRLKPPVKKVKPSDAVKEKQVKKPLRDNRGYLVAGGASLNPKGRPKGTCNKFTSLKKAFLGAFDRLGGVDGLVLWAAYNNANMRVFYQMTARMLPREISLGDLDIKPNDLSSLRDEELDAIIANNFKGE